MANTQPILLAHGVFGYGPKKMGGFNYWGLDTNERWGKNVRGRMGFSLIHPS